MPNGRVFIDITMAARMGGQVDGILRVIRELARYSLSQPAAYFVVFDSDAACFRIIDRKWMSGLVEGRVIIDLPYFSADPKKRRRKNMAARWLSHPRRQAFLTLERMRSESGWIGKIIERVQLLLMSKKYRRDFVDADGNRRRLLTMTAVSSEDMKFAADDFLILCGSDWPAMYHFLKTRDRTTPGHIVAFCYDLIPILFPQYFLPETARQFALCFDEIFRVAEIVIFNSEAIRRDALTYSRSRNLNLNNSRVIRLGSIGSPTEEHSQGELPVGLERDRYILFVSTIEPRKGHAMLLSVWTRLAQTASCQQARFKMVFVGRRGWLVDELFTRLSSEQCVGESLHLLTNIDDSMLARLYDNAAFCVYPSLYEGFGLPIVESFRHGKAVIASNAGAIPEVVGDLSPCIDPRDEDLWFKTILSWIENPDIRKPYEASIRAHRERSWTEMGDDFFNTLKSFR